mmetsp:Transcript_80048/g.156963  ORF Transcript_80048/g.156963 Transcript_80048/m.156963 type:complete len:244 (+) Transcript_80048:276-1007(+)
MSEEALNDMVDPDASAEAFGSTKRRLATIRPSRRLPKAVRSSLTQSRASLRPTTSWPKRLLPKAVTSSKKEAVVHVCAKDASSRATSFKFASELRGRMARAMPSRFHGEAVTCPLQPSSEPGMGAGVRDAPSAAHGRKQPASTSAGIVACSRRGASPTILPMRVLPEATSSPMQAAASPTGVTADSSSAPCTSALALEARASSRCISSKTNLPRRLLPKAVTTAPSALSATAGSAAAPSRASC